MHHRRDVVFDHLLVDRIPMPVCERRARPIAAGRIGIEVDGDETVFPHALFEFGNAGFRIDARRLRQHRRADEILGEQRRDAVAQLVADGGPGGRDFKVADVVGHEAGARGEHGQIGAALLHQFELIGLDRLPQFVVGNLQIRRIRLLRGVLDRGDLAVAPRFESSRRGCVMAMTVDDHLLSPRCCVRVVCGGRGSLSPLAGRGQG